MLAYFSPQGKKTIYEIRNSSVNKGGEAAASSSGRKKGKEQVKGKKNKINNQTGQNPAVIFSDQTLSFLLPGPRI